MFSFTKDKLYNVAKVVLFALVLCSFFVAGTLCRPVADSEGNPRIIVNFNNAFDESNISISYQILGQDADTLTSLMSSSAINNIQSVANDAFDKDYSVSNLIYFTLQDGNVRFNNFEYVNNLELLLEYSGTPNTAEDTYCAVFVSLDSVRESQVLGGDYSAFASVDEECTAVPINATVGTSGLVLSMDAPSDGFVFLLTINDDGNNTGVIILVVGVIVCVVIIICLIIVFRSFLQEKRRLKYNAREREQDLEKLKRDKAINNGDDTASTSGAGGQGTNTQVSAKGTSTSAQSNAQGTSTSAQNAGESGQANGSAQNVGENMKVNGSANIQTNASVQGASQSTQTNGSLPAKPKMPKMPTNKNTRP